MSAKTFVDTNVLIYAHDSDAGTKHEMARAVLRDLWSRRAGILSTQVLQEFYVNVTKKIATSLPKPSARAVVDSYTVWCIETTPAEISAAFRIEDEAGIGFWDALIVAAAGKGSATRILSEDLNPGQIIAGVRIETRSPPPGAETIVGRRRSLTARFRTDLGNRARLAK
jgi:predicted nucleic acid-binding protein